MLLDELLPHPRLSGTGGRAGASLFASGSVDFLRDLGTRGGTVVGFDVEGPVMKRPSATA